MNTLVLLLRFFSLNSHKTGWTALVSPLLFKLAMSRPKPINVLLKPQTYFIVTVSVLSVIALVTFLSLVLVVMYSTSHLMAQRRRK